MVRVEGITIWFYFAGTDPKATRKEKNQGGHWDTDCLEQVLSSVLLLPYLMGHFSASPSSEIASGSAGSIVPRPRRSGYSPLGECPRVRAGSCHVGTGQGHQVALDAVWTAASHCWGPRQG